MVKVINLSKKLDETIFVLNEFNKLLDYNFNNDINYSEKKIQIKAKIIIPKYIIFLVNLWIYIIK